MNTFEAIVYSHGYPKPKVRKWGEKEKTTITMVTCSELARFYHVPLSHIMKILICRMKRMKIMPHKDGDLSIPLSEWNSEWLLL